MTNANRKFQIEAATTQAEWHLTRELFEEYAAQLGVDLCFQNFSQELATLPGAYAAPDGCILLARLNENPAGCVALRKIGEGVCEMKRLYVRPEFHGQGIGRALAEAIIACARERGYEKMRLDTLPSMRAAVALYQSLGFVERDAYYFNPTPDVIYFELALASPLAPVNKAV